MPHESEDPHSGHFNYHVVPHYETMFRGRIQGSPRWAVIQEMNDSVSGVFQTKKEAVDRASALAQNQGVGVVVHKRSGEVQRTIGPVEPRY